MNFITNINKMREIQIFFSGHNIQLKSRDNNFLSNRGLNPGPSTCLCKTPH